MHKKHCLRSIDSLLRLCTRTLLDSSDPIHLPKDASFHDSTYDWDASRPRLKKVLLPFLPFGHKKSPSHFRGNDLPSFTIWQLGLRTPARAQWICAHGSRPSSKQDARAFLISDDPIHLTCVTHVIRLFYGGVELLYIALSHL